jgi:hypothetical protein
MTQLIQITIIINGNTILNLLAGCKLKIIIINTILKYLISVIFRDLRLSKKDKTIKIDKKNILITNRIICFGGFSYLKLN